MSHEERGLYIALLCLQWGKGGLTDDDIARMATPSFKGSMHLIRSKFKLGADGLLRNDRLELERQKQIDFRLKCSESGKKGADRRWGGYSDPNGVAIKTPMGSGTGKDGSPISDLLSPDQKVRTSGGSTGDEPVLNPPVDPNWPKRIESINLWYCEQMTHDAHLDTGISTLWMRWFSSGFEEDDFKRVFKMKRDLVTQRGDHPGCLRLSNILQPERFRDDLMLAKQNFQKPINNGKPSAGARVSEEMERESEQFRRKHGKPQNPV